MAKKMPRFFCDNCGTEVAADKNQCPNCGRYFSAIRCPKCGFSGDEATFKNGCPSCGYSSHTKSAPPIPRSKKQKAKRAFLSNFLYVIIAGLMVLSLAFLLFYLRN